MEHAQQPQTQPATTRTEVVQTIAQQLGETAEGALQQLHLIVKKLGPERSLAFLQETLETEAQGGLMLPDGSRRRTPGGVFFYLVRTKGPPEAQGLWGGKPHQGKAKAQQRNAATPSPPALRWEDRLAVLQASGMEKGTAHTVKITVIGRPGTIVDKGTCILTTMQASKTPSLPKGLPTPPATSTTYTVYIAAKQWKQVAEAITDPEDVLIIEGFPQLDMKTNSIAVFATNTTTKKLQAARRQAQQAATASSTTANQTP